MDYRDKFYLKYSSTHTSNIYGNVTVEEIKRQFVTWKSYFGKLLPKNKNVKIMDLGCGNGGFVCWLQRSGYLNAEGIDASEEQIDVAKKLGISKIKKAEIKEFIKDKKQEYDVVFMRDVLEHFNKSEILDILEFVSQSLKYGGRIIVQVPNANNVLSGRLRYGDFTHETGFTDESVRQALLVSGFNVVEIYGTYPVIHGIKSFIRFVLWKIIEICLRVYVLVETGSGKGIFSQNIIAVAEK